MRRVAVVLGVLLVSIAGVIARVGATPAPTVYNVADGDVAGLIAAINAANASPGTDTINLAASGTYSLVAGYDVNNGLPAILDNLTINGHGATITRSPDDGTPNFRIFAVLMSGTVTFNDLTISNGRLPGLSGGAIFSNQATVEINNCRFSGNLADFGGAIYSTGSLASLAVDSSTLFGNTANFQGGAVFNINGTLTITNSTVAGNSAHTPSAPTSGYAGGILNWTGTAIVANSTIANNFTNFGGGGIRNVGNLFLYNVTIAGNLSTQFGSGILTDGGGVTTLANTILAGTPPGKNCAFASSSSMASLGHNLSNDNTCTAILIQAGDTNNTAAGLDPAGLQNNGGLTQTIALISGSPAIDAGDEALCAASPVSGLDQRGAPRPGGSQCDIGAYEAAPADPDAPVLTCAAPDGLWHSVDVTIACTAVDSGSGLASPGDASFTLITSVQADVEDSNASTGSRTICDNAGNCATAGPISGNKVDKRAPAVVLTAPTNGTYTLGQVIVADFDCADGGSGVASCVGSAANGSPVDTSTVGTHTFSVTAIDATGHSTVETRTYIVGYDVCILFDQTKAHKTGSTIPIKLQLCSASGTNVSSAAVALTATGVYQISTNAPGALEDSGSANPDFQFRFDVDKYIFNLSLAGFTQGTYALTFTAGSDPTPHSVQFQVK